MSNEKVSLIIPTKNRPQNVDRILDSLKGFNYLKRDDLNVVIVDSSQTHETKQVAISYSVEYLEAEGLGKSEAMNLAIASLPSEFIAFFDDDIILINEHWLDQLLSNFVDEEVAYVSGRVIAAETKSEAQERWEKKGALDKGSKKLVVGKDFFQRFYLHGVPVQFVTMGANHIVKRDILQEVGAHDERFGPGQAIEGAGADLDLTYKVLKAGHKVVYDPEALVAHFHPEDLSELRSKMYSYGISDTAIHAKFLMEFHDVRSLFQIAYRPGQNTYRLLKSVLGKYPLPPDIIIASILGNLVGPFAYLRNLNKPIGKYLVEP